MVPHLRGTVWCLVALSLVVFACSGKDSRRDAGGAWKTGDGSTSEDADATGCDPRDEDCPPLDATGECEVRSTPEQICDGFDDDCDGETDENLTTKCRLQTGICAGATTKCTQGSFPTCGRSEYGAAFQEQESKCDGKDNDCDGTTDPMSAGCGWTRMISSTSSQGVLDLSTGPEGDVYVAASSGSSLEGQPYAGGPWDGYLMRFTRSGNRSWARAIGTSGEDLSHDVAVNSRGNVYVAGAVGGELHQRPYSGSGDAFLIKYDVSGVRQWTRLAGGAGEQDATALALGGDGNVYIAGTTTQEFDGRTYNGGPQDAFVAKFDRTGSHIWTRLLGTSTNEELFELVADGDGNIYVGGTTEAGLHGRNHTGDIDGFVVKYEGSGTRRWTRLIGTKWDDMVRASAVDGSGKLYLAGSTSKALHGRAFNGGLRDAFVAQYSRSGSRNWTRLVGTSGRDASMGLWHREGGSVYLTGRTSGALNDDQVFNGGTYDGFVARFGRSGVEKSSELIGSSGWDQVSAVSVNDQNHVYIGGASNTSLTERPHGGGDFDAYLMRTK